MGERHGVKNRTFAIFLRTGFAKGRLITDSVEFFDVMGQMKKGRGHKLSAYQSSAFLPNEWVVDCDDRMDVLVKWISPSGHEHTEMENTGKTQSGSIRVEFSE